MVGIEPKKIHIHFIFFAMTYFIFILFALTLVPVFSPFPHLHPAPPSYFPKPIPILLSVSMYCK